MSSRCLLETGAWAAAAPAGCDASSRSGADSSRWLSPRRSSPVSPVPSAGSSRPVAGDRRDGPAIGGGAPTSPQLAGQGRDLHHRDLCMCVVLCTFVPEGKPPLPWDRIHLSDLVGRVLLHHVDEPRPRAVRAC